MQKGTRTKEKIPHSSLCKSVELSIPTAWEQLTQEQLRHVLALYVLYDGQRNWMECVKVNAAVGFAGITVERKTVGGWLCSMKDGRTFIMDSSDIPAVIAPLSFLEHPENMTVRLESMGKYKAVDMWLHDVPFGNYLKLENFYQAYLQTKDNGRLKQMATVLYQVPDENPLELDEVMQLSVLLWYAAVKARFAAIFPHFLKPGPPDGHGSSADQRMITVTQIRLLTKGDITKNEEVINTDTWDALNELEMLAIESEEFKRKYGKENV